MRNVNISFRDETYQKIANLVERRKISCFVNEAVEEKLQKQRQELKKQLIAGYKENASNKKLQKELAVWDETIDETLNYIDQREQRNG